MFGGYTRAVVETEVHVGVRTRLPARPRAPRRPPPAPLQASPARLDNLPEYFGWLGRDGRLVKDYERKVQTNETLIEVAMIRLILRRLARGA
jgi:hypothetical protein